MASDPKKHYTKEFLAMVDDALVKVATAGDPTMLLYRRPGLLNIRVKVECRPEVIEIPVIKIEAPT